MNIVLVLQDITLVETRFMINLGSLPNAVAIPYIYMIRATYNSYCAAQCAV
jgi:hypothetical protein